MARDGPDLAGVESTALIQAVLDRASFTDHGHSPYARNKLLGNLGVEEWVVWGKRAQTEGRGRYFQEERLDPNTPDGC